jgi:hypothetical protein
MNVNIIQTEIEKKLHQAKEGFLNLPSGTAPFVFAERPLVREEVIDRLQKGLDLFEEVRRTRAAHRAAVEAQRNAVAGLNQFHAEAMQVAHQHFGSDPKRMATFGAKCPPRPKRNRRGCRGGQVEEVVTTTVEEVTVVSEQASCEGRAPSCEKPTRKPCRAKRMPSRVKPPCEEQKACGSRVSRSRK